MSTETPIRVFVLGGGVGAFTAAFDLTSGYAAQKRFEVTLFQHGWRMGGKAAGGRSGKENRVQEHGLHLLMGFYDHAFRVIRQCYGELRPDPDERFQNWSDAFTAQRCVTLGSPEYGDGMQTFAFPRLPGTPGDPRAIAGVGELALELLHWVEKTFLHAEDRPSSFAHGRLEKAVARLRTTLESVESKSQLFHLLLRFEVQSAIKVLELVRVLGLAPWTIHAAQLSLAFLHGCVFDVLAAKANMESINHLDFRAWLQKNGASKAAVSSPIVNGLYDLAFAYEDGDRERPRVEAGTMAKTVLRMALTYRDAPLFRMNAGMGDVVIGPLYRVLESRRVKLNLFHRVQSVTLSPDGKTVESIEVSRQVELKSGSYVPMKKGDGPLGGVYCWPAQPYWDQIVNGQKMHDDGIDLESATCTQEVLPRLTFRRGEHFDVVVMGLSVGAFPIVCKDLIDKHPEWRDMATRLKTVRTQAAQLWLNKTTAQLGFLPSLTVQSGGAPTFDSSADMTHLLAAEQWPDTCRPENVTYLCTVLPEGTTDPKAALAEVTRNARYWLDHQGLKLWPKAASQAGAFDDRLFVIPEGAKGAPLETQYLRANIDPTERYVLSVPGSSRFRRDADDSKIDNLYLAGDWVRTSINGGASEAAFEAGAACAKAIRDRYL
jgi:uncharacterized protein with NAD-binding domain and iron-sulfur cluster